MKKLIDYMTSIHKLKFQEKKEKAETVTITFEKYVFTHACERVR